MRDAVRPHALLTPSVSVGWRAPSLLGPMARSVQILLQGHAGNLAKWYLKDRQANEAVQMVVLLCRSACGRHLTPQSLFSGQRKLGSAGQKIGFEFVV